jgi:uncharacterized protein (DUF2336 family)
MRSMPKFPADPRLKGLYDLASRDGIDIRPTLLRVLTDLYVQKPLHTLEEERQFVELATGLIDAVDPTTRAIVAATLRDYAATPPPVWRKLSAEPPPPRNEDLCELFFAAPSEERRLILVNLVGRRAATPHAAPDTLARLEASALQRNPSEFTRTLRPALGVSAQLALRIVQDSSGEPLVVALKALGMPPAALQRVLLFLDPAIGQSVRRVHELAQLFDELSADAAAQMLAIWRAASPARKALHEPVTVDDERRSARSFANPQARRVNPAREPMSRKSQQS